MDVYTLCVYSHGIVASFPFSGRDAYCAAYIYPIGVGFHTLFFESKGPLIPQYAKNKSVELPAPFLFDSINKPNCLIIYLWSGVE